MGTALSVAGVVVLYAASLALFAAYIIGSIGLVRAASRTVRQGGLPWVFRAVTVMVAVVVAFVGGGLVFAFLWPFRQLRRTRPTGTRRRLLLVAAVLSVLLAGGCVTEAVATGPCFFDPPPGDQLMLTITNDTPAPVTVVDCLDDTCAAAQNATPVAVGRRASMQLEGCQGGTMGVLTPGSGLLQSCIAEPTEDATITLRPVTVSEGRPCAHGRDGARVHVVDAGG